MKPVWTIKLIDNMDEMHQLEQIQRQVWRESDTDIVPAHLMNSAVHNGGLLLGAFIEGEAVGFVFGFPGFYSTPDGPRLKHYSSMLGVLPEWRSQGIGFALREEYIHGETKDWKTFKFPTIEMMPETEILFQETPRPNGTLGATGIGEMTMISTAPSITNAIYNACGIRINHLPATPEKVKTALAEKK